MHDPLTYILGSLALAFIASIYYYHWKIMPSRDRLTEIQFVPPEPPPEPQNTPVEPRKNRIEACALAMQEFEGWWPGSTSYRHNNPGNCRAIDGSFLTFKTYEEGLAYLKDYLTRAVIGHHKAYPKGQDTTFNEFYHIYTGDPEPSPTNYAIFVTKRLGLSPTDKILTLLA